MSSPSRSNVKGLPSTVAGTSTSRCVSFTCLPGQKEQGLSKIASISAGSGGAVPTSPKYCVHSFGPIAMDGIGVDAGTSSSVDFREYGCRGRAGCWHFLFSLDVGTSFDVMESGPMATDEIDATESGTMPMAGVDVMESETTVVDEIDAMESGTMPMAGVDVMESGPMATDEIDATESGTVPMTGVDVMESGTTVVDEIDAMESGTMPMAGVDVMESGPWLLISRPIGGLGFSTTACKPGLQLCNNRPRRRSTATQRWYWG
jgi:hypothetical protein